MVRLGAAPRTHRLATHRRVPSVAPRSDRAAIVGTVSEAGTGRPLESAISLRSDSAASGSPTAARTSYTDSLGGFTLLSVSPGAYTIHFQSLGHVMAERHLVVRMGATDTVLAELQFFTCIGY